MFAHWFKTIALVAALAAGADASSPPSKMLEELFRNSVTISSPEIPTGRALRDRKAGKKEEKNGKAAKKGKKEKNGKSAKIEKNQDGVIDLVDGALVPNEGEFLPSSPSECILCNIVTDPNFEVLLNLVNLLFVDDWCENNPDTCIASIYGKNYTFFPPVNSALTAVIGPDPVAFVEAVGQDFLNTILVNHWVEGSFASSDLADGQELTSLAGFPLQISLGEQGAFVNDQEILAVDFLTSEGVYHPIGGVLLPPIPPQPPQ